MWSFCQCPIPAQESLAYDLLCQPVTTSSSPIWTMAVWPPNLPREVPCQPGEPANRSAPSVCMALRPRLLVTVRPSPVLAVGKEHGSEGRQLRPKQCGWVSEDLEVLRVSRERRRWVGGRALAAPHTVNRSSLSPLQNPPNPQIRV